MKNNDDSLLRKALRLMESSSDKAEDIAQDPEEMDELVGQSKKKMQSVKGRKQNFSNFFQQLITFQRMLKAYSKNEYRNLPWRSLLSIIGAILYFLNPFDIIPDFIPGIGLIDDITLLGWVYKSLTSDVERFEDWEYKNSAA